MKFSKTRNKRKYWIDNNDTPRYIVRTVQMMMRSLNLPVRKDRPLPSRITFYLLLVNMLVMQTAHVTYMVKHITDVAVMADTCATVSTTFQGIFKLISMYANSENIKNMCRIIYTQFWPTSVIKRENIVYKGQNKLASFSQILMIGFYVLIFFCCSLLLIPPLFLGTRNLPLASIYPFNTNISPLYESMYVWQWLLSLYGVCFVVGTHDFFFVAMMVQLIVQFRLLQTVLKQIGTENEKEQYKIVSSFNGNSGNNYNRKEEVKLLIEAVIHHIKLLDFADIVEKTFSPIVFLQFVESVSGLCLGVFLLNIVNGVNFLKLVFFIIGHLAQLLLYCIFGNFVMYESIRVSDAAFAAKWHFSYDRNVRAGLILIIQRAQRSKKITALGMADLNVQSFIEVLRSSISFSTLLKTFIEKQKNDNDA